MAYRVREDLQNELNKAIQIIEVSGNAIVNLALEMFLKNFKQSFLEIENRIGKDNFELIMQCYKEAIERKKKQNRKVKENLYKPG